MTLKSAALFLTLILAFASCSDKPTASDVVISTPELREQQRNRMIEEREQQEAEDLARFEAEKKLAWEKVVTTANTNFEDVKSLVQRKCYDCHDANTKLPFYGRILRRYNPVARHQRDGVAALDFSGVFPLKAKGNADQLALLKSIKGTVVDRSMPLRIYTRFYPSRKIFNSDESLLISSWLDPVIADIEAYRAKYDSEVDDGTMRFQAKKVFMAKCFQCHANGSNRGGFGNMEKLDELVKTKYVNLNNPEKSEIYQLSLSGEMPPREADRLTDEELFFVTEWIKEEARNKTD